MRPVVAVPVRSLGGMTRLAPDLSATERSRLTTDLLERAVGAARAIGAEPIVVTADEEVRAWAGTGLMVVADPEDGGLNAAALAAIDWASPRPWLILHGDLPLVTESDVAAMFDAVADRPVLAPSYDGGTTAVASRGADFPFRFGPDSFRRHLTALGGRASVVVRRGLALDIDNPSDLALSAMLTI